MFLSALRSKVTLWPLKLLRLSATIKSVLGSKEPHVERLWQQIVSWPVVSVVVGIVIGIGLGVLSMTPPEFVIAKGCFVFAAAVLLTKVSHWLSSPSTRKVERMILSFLIFGVIGAILVEGLHWVRRRQQPASAVEMIPLSILYDRAVDEEWVPIDSDCTIGSGVHVFHVTIHNPPDNPRIAGIKVQVERTDPNVPRLRNRELHLMGDGSRREKEFELNGGESKQIDVIESHHERWQQSYVQHTDLAIPTELPLPPSKYTLYLCVSANGLKPVVNAFETEYDPETRVLAFWRQEDGKPAPSDKEFPWFLELILSDSALSVGEKFSCTVQWMNHSQEVLRNAYVVSRVFVVNVTTGRAEDTLVRQQVDDRPFVFAKEEIRRERKRYCDGNQQMEDIEVKRLSKRITDVTDAPLTADDIQGLKNRTKRIYIMSWLAWTDSKGTKRSRWDCRWTSAHLQKEWNRCERTPEGN